MNTSIMREVEARAAAMSAAAVASIAPNPYASEARFRCPQTGAAAIGGLSPTLTLEQAMETSTRLGTAVWALVDGVPRPFAGANALKQYQLEAKRGNVPVAEPMQVPTTQPAPTSTERTRTIRKVCARLGCGARCTIDQTLCGDPPTWTPDAGPLLRHAGWTDDGCCSQICSRVVSRPAPPAVKPVETLQDRAFQQHRARTRAPEQPLFPGLNREVPDGKVRRGTR